MIERDEFERAASQYRSGPSQWLKTKNMAESERRNLQATVEVLPQGALRWRGFNRLLQILEAHRAATALGSMTAFNAQAMRDLEQGASREMAAAALSLPRALTFVSDAYKRFRLGRGINDLAKLFTTQTPSHSSRPSRAPPRSQAALQATARILARSYVGVEPRLSPPLTTPRVPAQQPEDALEQ